MNYEDSVRSLLALGRELAAPQQARVQKFGLENISALAADLGNPHRAIPCAHIAGTNGKGSTAAILESILRDAGLRTGLYTSPHLERINERIRLNGEPVSDEIFAAAWTRVHASIESLMASGKLTAHPTYFECVTAMAFLIFAEQSVDFAIYEVGLGGRLDSTNIVTPEVAIITPIDFDHENFLGHSIAEIAAEKAGIIKPGVTVVSSVTRPEARSVIAHKCVDMRARLAQIDEEWRLKEMPSSEGSHRALAISKDSRSKLAIAPALPGRFQLRNALAAATAARVLSESRQYRIEERNIERGVANVKWPGRLERLSENPTIYLDGAHNPSGARELLEFWQRDLASRRIILVYGAMRDKAVDEIAGVLFPHAHNVILTEPRQPRAISVSLLSEMTAHLASRRPTIIRDPLQAFDYAVEIARDNDALVVAGSLYLVGDLRSHWRNRTLATQVRP
ncbi:MAG: folylpolyglutamate synthase/dihydrofolate synthase family protein [Candidatus Acidiferrales bacterium]